jgi:glutathione S-transferase
MILIGQYDSPFVRRVGIALTLYALPFEHRPWSTFGDMQKVQGFNPLVRVPTLVLDDGVALIESHCILDYLDELVGPARAMFPESGTARRDALKVAALATGMGDKGVSLFYERLLHEQISDAWVQRCRTQIQGVARALEADRSQRTSPYWFGDHIGHADIAVAAVLRFIGEAHAGLLPAAEFPALADHAARLEALPVFQAIVQPLIAPAA